MAKSSSLISHQNLHPTPYTPISTTNPGVSKAMSHSQQDRKTASCSPVQVFKRLVNKKNMEGDNSKSRHGWVLVKFGVI